LASTGESLGSRDPAFAASVERELADFADETLWARSDPLAFAMIGKNLADFDHADIMVI
jgi:hypothetical protein